MQAPTKLQRTGSTNSHIPEAFVTFQIYKYVHYGHGLFVCGNLPKLGNWNPHLSLRLQWSSHNKWVGEIAIPKDMSKLVEFKLLVSQWDITPASYKEWEDGFNRVIEPKSLNLQSYYVTEWNRQNFTLCLRVNSKAYQSNAYYVTGSLYELGEWKQKKSMQPIEGGLKKKLLSLLNSDFESLSEAEISNFFVFSFSVIKYINSFNYFYYRWGQTVQSENYPGRIVQLDKETVAQEGRILELNHLGERIIIDESCFDDFVLQKMNNQIYLASYLKNSVQFYKLMEKRVTAFLHLQSTQPQSINSCRIKSLCKENGVFFRPWIIENITSFKFIDQAKEIISIVESLIVQGHRVCIHCSGDLLRYGPIKILYLALLGHPFKQAVEQVSEQITLSENNCKVTECVLQLINKRIRGKFNFHINQSV